MHPHNLAGAYPNFMMADEGAARIKATFGDNYPASPRSRRSSIPATCSASTTTSDPPTEWERPSGRNPLGETLVSGAEA